MRKNLTVLFSNDLTHMFR